ncbi:CEI_1a_G0027290.mRNA.1.CDS.1 [Saccharomyces cerevisiae]|nr:EM14S01-3B_G0053450.mRNA.1.CDS.1 [Saccharomyces cerevisiae]CAI4398314.1 AMH_1a_G0027350.mRNA.1.CDS.1 [Saccharomyces cerevisiae]CAI4409121.1 CEI_1a_G0027290.mRNA.1.CDS.1 [Saccharomyces cerevisiae]CAI6610654.1 AMH_1a_G0027350.mRNA.1.CDS.1 [Saccharomyces cerevisiae]CAI7246950.1 CEI_1a_G0027290.mRNA.1.CDS.1 [Saccharomyces cerevisiae]
MFMARQVLRNGLFLRSLAPIKITARTVASANSGIKRKSRFDKTMIKPLLLVMIFGSILNAVIAEKRNTIDMERKYKLKLDKLKELIRRVHDNNGKVDFDADDELKLVNLRLGIIGKNATAMKEDETDIVVPKEESLEEIWQSIIDEVKKEVIEKTPDTGVENKEGIVTDLNVLKDLEKSKKEDEKVYLSGDVHMMMNQPGDLNAIAKEHDKIPKFL